MADDRQKQAASAAPADRRLFARGAFAARARAAIGEFSRQIHATNPFATPELATPAVRALQIPPNIVLGSIIINLLGFALPLVVLQVYDRVIPHQAVGTLVMLVGGAILCVVVELALRMARAYVLGWNATLFGASASEHALRLALKSPPTDDRSPARMDDDFRTLEGLADRYSGQFRLALLDVPFVILFFTALVFAGGWVALVPIATTFVFGLRIAGVSRRIRATYRKRIDNDDKRFDFLTECLTHIETVKSLALEAQLLRRTEALQRQTTVAHFDGILATSQAQNLGVRLASATNVLVVSAGALEVIAGHMSVGGVAACSLLASRLIQPILRLSSTWTDLQTVNIEIEAAKPLFERANESELRETGDVGAAPVQARNLRFQTRNGAQFYVENLEVKRGETTVLSAQCAIPAGMFFEIINGRAKALTGSATVAGVNVAEARDALRETIGLLPESPATFSGSLLENMTMFGAVANAEEAYAVCRALGIEQFVHALPAGYETDVASAHAEALQHGLLKMIALARLILLRRPILLLKNPQAGLATPFERALARWLKDRPREQTIVMLTDSPRLTAAADALYHFEDGALRPASVSEAALKESA